MLGYINTCMSCEESKFLMSTQQYALYALYMYVHAGTHNVIYKYTCNHYSRGPSSTTYLLHRFGGHDRSTTHTWVVKCNQIQQCMAHQVYTTASHILRLSKPIMETPGHSLHTWPAHTPPSSLLPQQPFHPHVILCTSTSQVHQFYLP